MMEDSLNQTYEHSPIINNSCAYNYSPQKRKNLLTSLILKPSLAKPSKMLLQPVQTTRNINRLNTGVSTSTHNRIHSTSESIKNHSFQENSCLSSNQPQQAIKSYQNQGQVLKASLKNDKFPNLERIKENQYLNQTVPLDLNSSININSNQPQAIYSSSILNRQSLINPMTINNERVMTSNLFPYIQSNHKTKNNITYQNLSNNISSERKNETVKLFQDLKQNRQDLLRNHRQLLSLQKPSFTNNSYQRTYTSHNKQTQQHNNNNNIPGQDNIVSELMKINMYTQDNRDKNKYKLQDYSTSLIRNSYNSQSSQSPQKRSGLLSSSIQIRTQNQKINIKENGLNTSQNVENVNLKIKSQNQQRALSLLFDSYKSNLNQKYKSEIRNSLQTAVSTRSQQQQQSPSNQNGYKTSIQDNNKIQINQLIQKQKYIKANTEVSPSKNASTLRDELSQRKQNLNHNKNESYRDQRIKLNLNPNFNESLQVLQTQQENYRNHIRSHSRTSQANKKFIQPLVRIAQEQTKVSNLLQKNSKNLKVTQSLDESVLMQQTSDNSNSNTTNINTNLDENITNNNNGIFLTQTGISIIQKIVDDDEVNLLDNKLIQNYDSSILNSQNRKKSPINDINIKQQQLKQQQPDIQIINKQQIIQKQNIQVTRGKISFVNIDSKKNLGQKKQQIHHEINQPQQSQCETSKDTENKFMKLMKFDLEEEFNKIQKMMLIKKQKVTISSSIDDSGRSKQKTQSSRRVRFDMQMQPSIQTQQNIVKLSQPET